MYEAKIFLLWYCNLKLRTQLLDIKSKKEPKKHDSRKTFCLQEKKKKDVKVYILEKSEYWILLFCSYTEILILEKMKALEMNS